MTGPLGPFHPPNAPEDRSSPSTKLPEPGSGVANTGGMKMTTGTGSGSRAARIAVPAAIVAAALLFCWPAVYNGYPLVYGDTASYIDTIDPRKTNWSRPVFYTLLLRPLHWRISLWPVVLAQGLMIAHILYLALRVLLPKLRADIYLAIAAALAIGTSLPWHVSAILPDVFTPVVVLGVFLLGLGRDRLSRREALYVGILTTVAVICHLSHIAIAAGLVPVVLALRALLGFRPVRALSTAAVLVAPVAVAVSAHVAVNKIGRGEMTLSPGSPIWLLARTIGDGPGRAYLRDVCPGRGYVLCGFVDELPDDSDEFLWGERTTDAVFHRAGGFEALRGEAREIVSGTIAAYPLEQLSAVARNTVRQFFRVGTGDWLDFGADKPAHVVSLYIRDMFPRDNAAYLASAQVNDRIPIVILKAWHVAILVVASMIGLALLVAFRQRLPSLLIGFFVLMLAALWGNAFVAGGISAVHDRYQTRLVWLVVFFVAATAVWVAHALGSRRVALPRPAARLAE